MGLWEGTEKSRRTGEATALPAAPVKRIIPFYALSGLSWISLGLIALGGVAFAWVWLDYSYEGRFEQDQLFGNLEAIPMHYVVVLGLAACVFGLMALGLVTYFTRRKAERLDLVMDRAAIARWLGNFSIPLFTGILFGAVLIFHFGLFGLAAPISLIFYGLALTHSSYFSLEEISYLGYAEILLGLISCFLPRESLIFWGLGFGVFHVIFGTWIYLRHEV